MNENQREAIHSTISETMGKLCACERNLKADGKTGIAAKLDRATDLMQEVLDEMDTWPIHPEFE